jgi:hypothetical protein
MFLGMGKHAYWIGSQAGQGATLRYVGWHLCTHGGPTTIAAMMRPCRDTLPVLEGKGPCTCYFFFPTGQCSSPVDDD